MLASPPASCPSAALAGWTLGAGSELWRIHSRSFAAAEFNFTPAEPLAPLGRFDSDGTYGYLYAGESQETAIAERFLRGEVTENPAARYLEMSRLKGLRLSEIRATQDIELLPLCTARELGRVGQDVLLVHCDESEYARTYLWGRSIRVWAPMTSGFRWISRRDTPRHSYVFYSDRLADGALEATGIYVDLDEPRGQVLLLKILRKYNVTLSRP
jgi:hypothetical protein